MLSERYRSLELVIKNRTPDNLEFVNVYFNSGGWLNKYKPHTVKPKQIWYDIVANEPGMMTGVTGALQLNNGHFNISLGFTNPVMGCYKTSVCAGTAQEAYDLVSDASQPKKVVFGPFTLTVHQEKSTTGAMAAFVYELQGEFKPSYGGGGDVKGQMWNDDIISSNPTHGSFGKNQHKITLDQKYRIKNK